MIRVRRETKFKEMENGYDIPLDWKEKTINQVLIKLEKGKTPKKIKGKFPYFSAKFLRGEKNSGGKFGQEAGVFVKEDDIVILWDGGNSGEVFKGKSGILASTMCKVEFDDSFNKEFLYVVLKAREDELKDSKSGTDDRHLDKDYFFSFPIQCPSIKEQSRIANVIIWFDELIENKKRQNEILEKTAMAIFKSWFIDFEPFKREEFVDSELGKIPKGCEIKSIGKLFNLIKGKAKSSQTTEEYIKDYLPYVDVETYKKGYPMFWVEKKQPIVDEKDIAIIADGESSGRIFRYQQGVLSSTLLVLKQKTYANDYDIRHLVYLWLKNLEDELMFNRTGTYIQHLDKGFLSMLSILLPPDNLLKKFHSLVEPVFNKIITNQKQIMVIKKIRDTLLPLLVFGKLRVEEI